MFDLRILITPALWFRNYKTNKIWDKSLNKLLDKNPKIEDSILPYRVYLDDVDIWIKNWGYAYGHRVINGYSKKALPSRSTSLRLRDYLKDYLEAKRIAEEEKYLVL